MAGANNRIDRANIFSTDNVINRINHTLEKIECAYSNNEMLCASSYDSYKLNLHELSQNLERISGVISSELYSSIYGRISSLKRLLEAKDTFEQNATVTKVNRVANSNKKGNSYCDIDSNKLQHLLSIGFGVKQIASDGLLGGVMHRNTLHNYMKRNSIPGPTKRYANISDCDLSKKLKELTDRYPHSGVRELLSHLRAQDPPLVVQRRRIEKLLAAVDSVGMASRWAQAISRRVYSVATPNSLWHIDTNHALIRWNFVVDGCIDGYSRLIPYLILNTNNLASSAFRDFVSGIQNYGIPSRIRVDGGGEFVHVKKFMAFANGEDRGSFIVGKSVHNQRIERLWRDVYVKVLDKYYKLFNYMEDHKILDINNSVHVGCLHYVFSSRINKDLKDWVTAHNNHPIRTEGNATPKQLWYRGSTINSKRDLTAINNIYNLDENSILPLINSFFASTALIEPDDIQIVLPRYPLPLTQAENQKLCDTIDHMASSVSHGIDIYADVLKYINECVCK